MQRLLIENFWEEQNIPISEPAVFLNLVMSCNRENLDTALKDHSVLNLIGR